MGASEILEVLDREPFEPFRIVLTSGESYIVRNPHAVAVLKSRLFIALDDGERWVFCPYLHIAAVEALSAA